LLSRPALVYPRSAVKATEPAADRTLVFFFTLALFLSGYALQQRTLRHLREAIKPKPKPAPSPLIFLPDRFKDADRFSKDTTELEDGTVVVIHRTENATPGGNEGAGEAGKDGEKTSLSERQRSQREKLMREILGVYPQASEPDFREDDAVVEGEVEGEVADDGDSEAEIAAVSEASAASLSELREDSTPLELQEVMVQKDEQQQQALVGPAEKPISRAERRRKIREEIQRLARSDKPVYYQRRLW
jgi:hypothetical protein